MGTLLWHIRSFLRLLLRFSTSSTAAMEAPPHPQQQHPPPEVVAEHVHALEAAEPHGFLEHETHKHGRAPDLKLKPPHQEAAAVQASPDPSLPHPDAGRVAEKVHALECQSPKGYLEHEMEKHHGRHPDLRLWPEGKPHSEQGHVQKSRVVFKVAGFFFAAYIVRRALPAVRDDIRRSETIKRVKHSVEDVVEAVVDTVEDVKGSAEEAGNTVKRVAKGAARGASRALETEEERKRREEEEGRKNRPWWGFGAGRR